jgi:hypothetical protein
MIVGSFPGIYVIGNKIKLTKVARFNLVAEFREKTVKKWFLFDHNISLAFRSVGLYFAALSRLDSELSESATSTLLWQL